MQDSSDDYLRFVERLDAHCDAIARRHADRLACAPGCASCCHRQLTVFEIEAEVIRSWMRDQGGLGPFDSDIGAEQGGPLLLLATKEEPCAFLDAAGRCRIYPVRPVICRTHGLPLAIPDESGGSRGDCCPLNFREGMDELSNADFLSLETVNTVLTALNRAFVRSGDPAGGVRVELRALAAQGGALRVSLKE